MIYLKLDNSECTSRCFSRADLAAKFIATAVKKGWSVPGIPIKSIGGRFSITIKGFCMYVINVHVCYED